MIDNWIEAQALFEIPAHVIAHRPTRMVGDVVVDDTPHKMKGQEIFILFQIAAERQDTGRISQCALTHPLQGYTIRQSYVADINSMLHLRVDKSLE